MQKLTQSQRYFQMLRKKIYGIRVCRGRSKGDYKYQLDMVLSCFRTYQRKALAQYNKEEKFLLRTTSKARNSKA